MGHSRGGKLSVLAAARDPRVTACCLLDPVDNTKYAPLGPEYPSAVAALHQLSMQASRWTPSLAKPTVPLLEQGVPQVCRLVRWQPSASCSCTSRRA